MNKVVCLLSGGLDSSVLFAHLVSAGNDVYPVFIDYGQQTLAQERAAAEAQILSSGKSLFVMQMPKFAHPLTDNTMMLIESDSMIHSNMTHPKAFVPYRNTLFALLAGAYATSIGAKVVALGLVGIPDPFVDASPAFLADLNVFARRYGNDDIEFIAPLLHKEKAEVVSLGVALKVDFSKTWSCYNSFDKPCGDCQPCLMRQDLMVDVL
jgi:7-cyano-7-deazaguanine synthase